MLQSLIKNFLRGLLFVVPIAATLYVIYTVVGFLDGWVDLEPLIGRRAPGAGLVLTLAAITTIGFLAGNFATRWLFGALDRTLDRLPLVHLLYSSVRDLVGAFVGEKKRFGKPVLVSVGDHGLSVVGFQTRDELAEYGLVEHVAVYVPQSYNFAGNLLVVPRSRVTPLALEAKAAMAFVVSGGVSGAPAPPATSSP
jgi:uncharacterized membrane protein